MQDKIHLCEPKRLSLISGTKSSSPDDEEINEWLISFYRKRYLYFLEVGIGGDTTCGTKVTETLIKATANRLDQLIRGKITDDNRNHGDDRTCLPYPRTIKSNRLFNSNRSFGWNDTSQFRYSDLDFKQKHSIDCPTIITETYIDKYTTAYQTIREYREYE